MDMSALISEFERGPKLLREAVDGMTQAQLLARPVAGRWSTLEVICHLSDFEIVAADRIKRVIAEHEPILPAVNENALAASLVYHQREAEEELLLIETIRKQVARILSTLQPQDFQRAGIHPEVGPLTLCTLMQRRLEHIPHHTRFILQKRRILDSGWR